MDNKVTSSTIVENMIALLIISWSLTLAFQLLAGLNSENSFATKEKVLILINNEYTSLSTKKDLKPGTYLVKNTSPFSISYTLIPIQEKSQKFFVQFQVTLANKQKVLKKTLLISE